MYADISSPSCADDTARPPARASTTGLAASWFGAHIMAPFSGASTRNVPTASASALVAFDRPVNRTVDSSVPHAPKSMSPRDTFCPSHWENALNPLATFPPAFLATIFPNSYSARDRASSLSASSPRPLYKGLPFMVCARIFPATSSITPFFAASSAARVTNPAAPFAAPFATWRSAASCMASRASIFVARVMPRWIPALPTLERPARAREYAPPVAKNSAMKPGAARIMSPTVAPHVPFSRSSVSAM